MWFFILDNEYYMLSLTGTEGHQFSGFKWNGSGWIANTAIGNGTYSGYGSWTKPNVIWMGSNLFLITSLNDGVYKSYKY